MWPAIVGMNCINEVRLHITLN